MMSEAIAINLSECIRIYADYVNIYNYKCVRMHECTSLVYSYADVRVFLIVMANVDWFTDLAYGQRSIK